MKAVALDFAERSLQTREIPEPVLKTDTDVLFRVREVGVCGTDRDLASFRLSLPRRPDDYLILGHEAVGEVLRTGAAVTSFRPGDLVVPMVRRPCHRLCDWCAKGRRDLCSSGEYTERGILGAHGYLTELAVDHHADLIAAPATVVEHAVLIEPLSVVEKAVGNAFRLHPGDPRSALILGAGTVGLLSAMLLRLCGIRVTISSVEPVTSERARIAEQAGAEYRNRCESGYDIVIEAAGAPDAVIAGFQALAPAGVLVVLGAAHPVELAMLQLIVKNQVVAGSVNASPEDFRRAASDLGKFPVAVLRRMVRRAGFSECLSTLTGPPRPEPKVVHVLG